MKIQDIKLHNQQRKQKSRGKFKTITPTNLNLQEALGERNIYILNQIKKISDSEGTQVFLFGGAVRDCLLGQKANDLDIAVNGNALEFCKILKNKFPEIFSRIFLKHSVKRAVAYTEDMHIDIVPLDKEGKKAENRQQIRRTLIEKAKEADFTVNSMMIELKENEFGMLKLKLIDFLGGVKDLREGILKRAHTGSPSNTIRGLRIKKTHGMKINTETNNAMKNATKIYRIRSIPEYIRTMKSMFKLLKALSFSEILQLSSKYNIFKPFFH